MTKPIFAPVPALKTDWRAEPREPMSANARMERRIVANLIAHLERAGWAPYVNDDGGERVRTPDMQSAMESVFSVDESRLHFAPVLLVADVERALSGGRPGRARLKACRKLADEACHAVLIVLGNGEDCISDWSYKSGDADGFNAAMEAFNAEDYADAGAECEYLRGELDKARAAMQFARNVLRARGGSTADERTAADVRLRIALGEG